jgi:hypothetical protein
MLRLIARLPEVRPDPQRASRLRQTCRQQLARSGGRPAGRAIRRDVSWVPALVALGAGYFAVSVRLALQLAGAR